MVGAAIGYAMDGFDLLILGFMLPAISVGLQLGAQQAGALVTCTLLGAVAGGIVFGALSDRFGRVRVLTWTIMLFAIFTGLCAFAQGFWDLLAYRTIAGIGLGGEFGIGMALAAEAWPASKRARVSSYVALGWQSSVLLAALVTPFLLKSIGWRGMFAVGVLPALVAWVLRNKLHEPELFVQSRKPVRTTRRFRLLVADGRTARTSLGIVILCSVQNFGYYGIMIWMPTRSMERGPRDRRTPAVSGRRTCDTLFVSKRDCSACRTVRARRGGDPRADSRIERSAARIVDAMG